MNEKSPSLERSLLFKKAGMPFSTHWTPSSLAMTLLLALVGFLVLTPLVLMIFNSLQTARPGEPIVLDIGGRLGGYHSDITRTLWVTGEDEQPPSAEFSSLYATLQRAQAAGRAAVRPGISAEQLDGVARGVIDDAGLGEHFIHRTGHGIGLEVHEDPYIVAGNETLLEPGHAFSVEPGIYIDGRHGARIEDIVVCAADGPDELNRADRGLYVVRG